MIVNKPLPQPNSSGNEFVVSINIYAIDELVNTIYVYGVNEEGIEFTESFALCYKGTGKNVPFTLTKAEIDKIKATE